MKIKMVLFPAMMLLFVSAACGAKAYPVGVYEPAQASPTDRITEFSFAADGTFTSSYYDGKAATGTYSVTGDKITLIEMNEDSPCIGAPATMTWTASADTLAFEFFEDACSQGPSYDWAREWVKKP